MSKLRPTLKAGWGVPLVSNGTAYYAILGAVSGEDGLVHGKLREKDACCAIGSYFKVNPKTALPEPLIDEVAAVNDSVPHLSNRQRKAHVARWLRWKLAQLGMPGMRPPKRPPSPTR